MRVNARPHVYACSHLANTASLLLPVSNLTNLLALRASRLSFSRFAALMVLPWLAGLAIEWVVLRRAFGPELQTSSAPIGEPEAIQPLPRFAVAVLALTLVGFAISSVIGVAPVWGQRSLRCS